MIEISNLPKVSGQYRENTSLAPFTWLKVGGNARILFKPDSIEDLAFFLSNFKQDVEIVVLGAGSNILIRDGGIDGVVIRLGRNFSSIDILSEERVKVGASCLNYHFAQFCYQNSIEGFEFLVGIPGSIGGGIAMNAGAYHKEFKDIIFSVEALDRNGKIHNIENKDIGFIYRANSLPKDWIFTSAIFHYKKGDINLIKARMDSIIDMRAKSQPVKEKTCGSTFKNLQGQKVWELIDKASMRGARLGGAEISNMHCNFMINRDNANAKDLEDLGEMVRQKVFESSGVTLEWEVKRIGKRV